MQIEVEVLDEKICSRCDDFDIVCDNNTVYFAGGAAITWERHYKCSEVGKCKKLKRLLVSAKESTPNIEEATSDP